MANQLHEFTVQEAQNFKAYTTYKFEKKTMDGNEVPYTDWNAADYGPAKHLVIYATGGEDDDMLVYLQVGGSYGQGIELNANDLPLTISGLLVERVKIDTTSGNNDVISILSFH
tara:strand:+ start:449 stop:790 length:342 start_codon:yes stop_codon:yes gene_type:complete